MTKLLVDLKTTTFDFADRSKRWYKKYRWRVSKICSMDLNPCTNVCLRNNKNKSVLIVHFTLGLDCVMSQLLFSISVNEYSQNHLVHNIYILISYSFLLLHAFVDDMFLIPNTVFGLQSRINIFIGNVCDKYHGC